MLKKLLPIYCFANRLKCGAVSKENQLIMSAAVLFSVVVFLNETFNELSEAKIWDLFVVAIQVCLIVFLFKKVQTLNGKISILHIGVLFFSAFLTFLLILLPVYLLLDFFGQLEGKFFSLKLNEIVALLILIKFFLLVQIIIVRVSLSWMENVSFRVKGTSQAKDRLC